MAPGGQQYWQGYKRVVRVGAPMPYLSSDESISEGNPQSDRRTNLPTTQFSVDSIQGSPAPSLPASYRAPVATMTLTSPTKVSATKPPAVPASTRTAPVFSTTTHTSDSATPAQDSWEPPPLVDDTEKDPDYSPDPEPPASTRKRQMTTSFERNTKLRKVTKKAVRRPHPTRNDDLYAGPESFSSEAGSEDRSPRRHAKLPSTSADNDGTEDDSPILKPATIAGMFRKQTESPRMVRTFKAAVSSKAAVPGPSGPREVTIVDLSYTSNPTTELRDLLLNHLDPTSDDEPDKGRFVKLLRECWELQESTLKDKLGDSYRDCKDAFDIWVAMLERLGMIQSRTGYQGSAGDEWVAHCYSLTNAADRFQAARAQTQLQNWRCMLKTQCPPNHMIEPLLRNHLAAGLHVLTKMPDWLRIDDLANRLSEYNKGLLPWFLDE
ncbi:hypothetical protein M011DRAFT_87768 [Sporormia fimetaria CBS 119925]|uniref:Uncharacterized protein n=1 Tax=Sporormia fimetaria CBS 119925 TaxID=1340428 RepID=A0A6A6V9J1_9PLEO|nr:hypothetical protein M011DRAFT_87768 [Sporormia fimetaria CBS 119925]